MTDYEAAYAAAAAAAEHAQAQLGQATADVKAGEADSIIAKARLADALRDTDPVASLAALDEAETRLAKQTRLADALAARYAALNAEAARCWGERERPDMEHGRGARIAACAKADAAKAMLAEAEAEHAAATAVVQAAHARGLVRTFDGGMLLMPLRTEADERALWEAAR